MRWKFLSGHDTGKMQLRSLTLTTAWSLLFSALLVTSAHGRPVPQEPVLSVQHVRVGGDFVVHCDINRVIDYRPRGSLSNLILNISRMVEGDSQFHTLAVYKGKNRSSVKHRVAGRDWTFTTGGAADGPPYSSMELKLMVRDAVIKDTGMYRCQVTAITETTNPPQAFWSDSYLWVTAEGKEVPQPPANSKTAANLTSTTSQILDSLAAARSSPRAGHEEDAPMLENENETSAEAPSSENATTNFEEAAAKRNITPPTAASVLFRPDHGSSGTSGIGAGIAIGALGMFLLSLVAFSVIYSYMKRRQHFGVHQLTSTHGEDLSQMHDRNAHAQRNT